MTKIQENGLRSPIFKLKPIVLSGICYNRLDIHWSSCLSLNVIRKSSVTVQTAQLHMTIRHLRWFFLSPCGRSDKYFSYLLLHSFSEAFISFSFMFRCLSWLGGLITGSNTYCKVLLSKCLPISLVLRCNENCDSTWASLKLENNGN